jgi:hypothetical protein
VRGYGVHFWLFCQDLSTIKARYDEAWGTFLANADVLQAVGVNDLETSEHLSRLTGEATIAVETENTSRGVRTTRLPREVAHVCNAAQPKSALEGRRLRTELIGVPVLEDLLPRLRVATRVTDETRAG